MNRTSIITNPINNLGMPTLVLPKNFTKKKRAIMAWFRGMDEKLVSCVESKQMRIEMAQTYFKYKVENCPDLSHEDKQTLANDSQLWKMPS